MFAILASYFSNAVLLTNKLEKYTLQATIFSAIINIVLNIFLIPKMDYNGAAITTVISEICVFIICFRQAKYLMIIDIKKRDIFSTCLGSLFIIVLISVLKRIILSSILLLIIAIPMSIIGYFAILFAFRNSFIELFTKVKK